MNISLYRQIVYKVWILRSKELYGTSWSYGNAYGTLRALPGMPIENGWNKNEWLLDALCMGVGGTRV